MIQPIAATRSQEAILATNKVLKNTYLLLSMTILFSAVMAFIAVQMNIAPVNWIVSLVVTIGLLFAVHKTAESSLGLVLVFAFTGWLGFTLGPILNLYLSLPGGADILVQALGGTGLIFFALSGYVLTTRKDFSFMSGFLFVGLIVLVVAMLANIFLEISALSLAISAVSILLFSGFILYDTSNIIHGGETNYIRATVSLYLNIYNLFTSLLSLLTALSGDD